MTLGYDGGLTDWAPCRETHIAATEDILLDGTPGAYSANVHTQLFYFIF